MFRPRCVMCEHFAQLLTQYNGVRFTRNITLFSYLVPQDARNRYAIVPSASLWCGTFTHYWGFPVPHKDRYTSNKPNLFDFKTTLKRVTKVQSHFIRVENFVIVFKVLNTYLYHLRAAVCANANFMFNHFFPNGLQLLGIISEKLTRKNLAYWG